MLHSPRIREGTLLPVQRKTLNFSLCPGHQLSIFTKVQHRYSGIDLCFQSASKKQLTLCTCGALLHIVGMQPLLASVGQTQMQENLIVSVMHALPWYCSKRMLMVLYCYYSCKLLPWVQVACRKDKRNVTNYYTLLENAIGIRNIYLSYM